MRTTVPLSRMRLTSHIPCHTQRAHLWAAKHGCERTCALHRQSKRANHTEKNQGHAPHLHVSRCPHSNVPQQLFSRSRLGQGGGVFVEAYCVKDNAHAGAKTPVHHPARASTGDSRDALQCAPHIGSLRGVQRTNSPEQLLCASVFSDM